MGFWNWIRKVREDDARLQSCLDVSAPEDLRRLVALQPADFAYMMALLGDRADSWWGRLSGQAQPAGRLLERLRKMQDIANELLELRQNNPDPPGMAVVRREMEGHARRIGRDSFKDVSALLDARARTEQAVDVRQRLLELAGHADKILRDSRLK